LCRICRDFRCEAVGCCCHALGHGCTPEVRAHAGMWTGWCLSHTHYGTSHTLLRALLKLSHPSGLLWGWGWFSNPRRARISCHLPDDGDRNFVFFCFNLLQSDKGCSSYFCSACKGPETQFVAHQWTKVWRHNVVSWSTLFNEIIAVYTQNHSKCTQLLTDKEDGACSYHWALKG
jgi:hypothetical protein